MVLASRALRINLPLTLKDEGRSRRLILSVFAVLVGVHETSTLTAPCLLIIFCRNEVIVPSTAAVFRVSRLIKRAASRRVGRLKHWDSVIGQMGLKGRTFSRGYAICGSTATARLIVLAV